MDLFEYILETMNYNLYTEDYLFEAIDIKQIGKDLVGYVKKFFKWIKSKFKEIVDKFRIKDFAADADNHIINAQNEMMKKQYETEKEKAEIIKNLNKVKKYDYKQIESWIIKAEGVMGREIMNVVKQSNQQDDDIEERITDFENKINELCGTEFDKKYYDTKEEFHKEADYTIKGIELALERMSYTTEKTAKMLEQDGFGANAIKRLTNAQLKIYNKAMATLK